ncbi:hypothetical protein AK812_SmicGene26126 [Symbiodinium microadriaticum]|uniref:Uncharacterized protein n=1 Tax=Symbiodinium microadriaticum TaxID=2951 RepID=A0A1Q9DAB6_SYMMI|nr:hypothetical protein AK812_SmicGene26126 [Symbiodinium microadriaticum]CAE7629923.1 unnamed protein product [Symbiodinium sp. KB8]CAE7892780.1 unnamed protein product [Symbiodinium microadriaticum]
MAISHVCSCFLCRKLCTASGKLTDFAIDAAALSLLLTRFGMRGVPLLCLTCCKILRLALCKLDGIMESEVAQQMVLTAQAFANRDLWMGFPSVLGRVHSSLLFCTTCKWEPVLGRVAQRARRAVRKAAADSKLQALADTYKVTTRARKGRCKKKRNVGPKKKKKKFTRAPKNKRTQTTKSITTTAPRNLQAVLTNVTVFAAPFFKLMVQGLDFDNDTRATAMHSLSSRGSTAHGGGRVINAVLFGGARLVAESSSDIFGPADNMFGSHYTSCIANEVFGCILCFSKFGEAILETSRTPPQTRDDDFIVTDPDARFWKDAQAHFEVDAAKLQRFVFKLCELRKANMGTRRIYRDEWKSLGKRVAWLDQNPNHIAPFWGNHVAAPLPQFAKVAWKARGVETAVKIRKEALATKARQPVRNNCVLTSEEFGQAMALWRQQWEQEQLEQRGMKPGRDAFNGFVHAFLGHRTLARAIIQFGIAARKQLIKALHHADRFRCQDSPAQRVTQTGNELARLEVWLRYNWSR